MLPKKVAELRSAGRLRTPVPTRSSSSCDPGSCRTPGFKFNLQRDVSVFLGWVFVALGVQHFEGVDQLLAGLAGLDDGVHESALGGDVGISKSLAKFFDLFFANQLAACVAFRFSRVEICGALQFALVNDVHRTFWPHDSD